MDHVFLQGQLALELNRPKWLWNYMSVVFQTQVAFKLGTLILPASAWHEATCYAAGT